jgi:hypothetical protein
MISLTAAERQKKVDECTHTRSLTCIPGSGSIYWCDDCGTYFSTFDFPRDTPVHTRRLRDHIITFSDWRKANAHRLW